MRHRKLTVTVFCLRFQTAEELSFDLNGLTKLKVCALRKILSANGIQSASPKSDLITLIKECYRNEDTVSVSHLFVFLYLSGVVIDGCEGRGTLNFAAA